MSLVQSTAPAFDWTDVFWRSSNCFLKMSIRDGFAVRTKAPSKLPMQLPSIIIAPSVPFSWKTFIRSLFLKDLISRRARSETRERPDSCIATC